MFWKTLNLVVNLTFLLLAITIMTMLLRNDSYRTDLSNYEISLEQLGQDINRVNRSNFTYLEDKINRVAASQDSYQSNMTRRIEVIDARQKAILESRSHTRVINNNTATANGVPLNAE